MPRPTAFRALVLVHPAPDEHLLRRERLAFIKEYLVEATEECHQLCRQVQALHAQWLAERPGSPAWISLMCKHKALLAIQRRMLREWQEWWGEYRLLLGQ